MQKYLKINVDDEEKFSAGKMAKVEHDKNHIFLRARAMGKPKMEGKIITVQGKPYALI